VLSGQFIGQRTFPIYLPLKLRFPFEPLFTAAWPACSGSAFTRIPGSIGPPKPCVTCINSNSFRARIFLPIAKRTVRTAALRWLSGKNGSCRPMILLYPSVIQSKCTYEKPSRSVSIAARRHHTTRFASCRSAASHRLPGNFGLPVL
jgi:hypothetical protein